MPGPLQLNVAPVVVDAPLSATVEEEHVIVCADPAFAFGGVVFPVTATWLLAEQPFPLSVTVRVYEPAALTVGVAVVPPETIPGPFQLNVTPGVEDDPLSVAEVEAHVIDCGVPALTFGAPEAAVTVI
jgi:hypothetical protein